jgi:hypothetical protein
MDAHIHRGEKLPTNSQNTPGQTSGFRWVMSRKAHVLSTIRSGEITLQQACSLYAISIEELTAWEEAFRRSGPEGLYATRRKNCERTFEFCRER